MKRRFGNVVSRLLYGGVILTSVEYALLESLIQGLPDGIRATVEAQFESYNLVQREIDGRALNFYRMIRGRADPGGIPLLKMSGEEAALIRLSAIVASDAQLIHASLTAVAGRAFSIAFSRALPAEGKVHVVKVKQAWRSNINLPQNA